VTAAICIAPVTLATAGLLDGRQASVWPDCRDALRARGARVVETPVARDGNIITASGPPAAADFGKALVQALSGS
jgi:putative intracellular protease/amidase